MKKKLRTLEITSWAVLFALCIAVGLIVDCVAKDCSTSAIFIWCLLIGIALGIANGIATSCIRNKILRKHYGREKN